MKRVGKFFLGLLCATLLFGTVVTVQAEEVSGNAGYTGLQLENDQWVYYVHGMRDTMTDGLVLYADHWFYLQDGVMDQNKNGFVEYNGGLFYVAGGQVVPNYSGLVQDGEDWYFIADGQVQNQFSGFTEYEGAWFLLEKGKLNQSYNSLYDYNGGRFLVAAGQMKADYSGLFQNTDGQWYFISAGQVQTRHTGLTLYDNEWFYIVNGVLDKDYVGYVEYDGALFWVENGQVEDSTEKIDLLTVAKENRKTYTSDIFEVLEYVNEYRAEVGVEPLSLDENLCVAACIRAQEMVDYSYFSHSRPNGEKCFTVLGELGISYRAAGENIARGYRTAESVSEGWYNSQGHYQNMINGKYDKIGIGVADVGYGKMWVQLFTGGY